MVFGIVLTCFVLGSLVCCSGVEREVVEAPAADIAGGSIGPVSETQPSLVGLDRSAWPRVTVGPEIALQDYYPTYFRDSWSVPADEPVMVDGVWHEVPATQIGAEPTWVYQPVGTPDQIVYALWGARAQNWSGANAADLGAETAGVYYNFALLPWRMTMQPPALRGRRQPGGAGPLPSEAAALGIFTQDDPAGCWVLSVVADGPAARVGLQSGDVITAIDRQSVHSAELLADIIARHRPGDVVTLRVWRAGKAVTVRAALGRAAPQ
jgi:hypothetical protein